MLTVYFFFLGILALTHLLSPFVTKMVPAGIPLVDYHILFVSQSPGKSDKEALIDYKFTSHDLVCLAFSTVVGLWYIFKKVKENEAFIYAMLLTLDICMFYLFSIGLPTICLEWHLL